MDRSRGFCSASRHRRDPQSCVANSGHIDVFFFFFFYFFVACTRPIRGHVCRSVGRSVGLSVLQVFPLGKTAVCKRQKNAVCKRLAICKCLYIAVCKRMSLWVFTNTILWAFTNTFMTHFL